MSKPKPSLLEPATIQALERAVFQPLIIEFFGQISGMAFALNNSTNPVAAANTMMKNPDVCKPKNKKSFSQMFEEFLARKRKRAAEQKCELPDELDILIDEHRRRGGLDTEPVPGEGNNDFEPEVFHAGQSQPDHWTDE